MPPKKDSEPTDGSTASILMSQQQLMSLINALNDSNKQTTQELLQQFQFSSQVNNQTGNFSKCTNRFSGSGESNVEAFIDSICTYKDCTSISDENALRGFPMLLEGIAATWWQGVKRTVNSWDEAVKILKDTYTKTHPPHFIFRDIFAREQEADESSELFICNIRALISKLPYELPLAAQLDIIYGLLHRKLRKRLPRHNFDDFENFLIQLRDIEQSIKESEKSSYNKTNVKTEDKKEKSLYCRYCKNFGHLKETCKRLEKKEKAEYANVPSVSSPRQVQNQFKSDDDSQKIKLVCYGCGTPGVIRSKCTKCQNNTQTEVQSVEFNQINLQNKVIKNPDLDLCSVSISRPLLQIQIDNFNGIGFADSGAQGSIAGANLYNILKQRRYKFTESKMRVSYADGNVQEKDVLKTNVNVCIKNKVIPVTFIIFMELKHNRTLLGVDFLEKAKIIINIANRCWYFGDNPDEVFPFAKDCTVDDSSLQICEVNAYYLRTDEGEVLNTSQRSKVNEVLAQASDIFASSGDPTDFAEHRIITDGSDPIAVAPYPLNNFKKQFLKSEIDNLLAANIIEECESPWASPVVLISKKNNPNNLRLCIDYRRLNSVTVSDSFPMPLIDDLLHSAKYTPFMSTIDLQSGYWQVPVAPADRDKTCFVTPFGTFRFNRMPFGLRNAPATFNRLMGRFCRGLGDRAVFTYLDDLLILSETFEKHIEDLIAVFERLRTFKLRARREKCSFVRNRVLYLGHVITPQGIEPNPEKTAAIRNLKEPSCVKHVHSFVQMCSWYRKFVPNFADIARPLTNLLKKNAKFQWGDAEKCAFNKLKDILTSSPILIQADQTKPYTLRTDASQFALGAVLLQGEEHMEKPIEYASRLLSPTERKFSTTEREALAIVWSTEKFRAYLENAEVTIATDHQPLKWLFTLKTPSGRLARWALRLQGLNMKIIYAPGKTNVIADLLSRPFCPHSTDNTCEICFVSVEIPRYTPEDIRTQQLEDEDVAKIIKSLESEDLLEKTRWSERGYQLSDGVLYHFNPDVDTENPQLVIPQGLREDILKQYHDADTAGHYGIDHTYQKIAEKFFWTGMRRCITNYIKDCLECQRYKSTNLKPAGLLQTPAPAQRFEVMAVDLFGPLPETTSANKWILIIEDIASRWVELFALPNATGEACAKLMIDEVFLRFGTPRKLISDNGVQFISEVMQKVTHCFGIKSSFIPLYHPASNPVERKNRELKTQLSILVQGQHNRWDEHLSSIRFSINSTVCDSTGQSPAYLTFGRHLRAPQDCVYDLRQIVAAENFVPRITPYLTKIAETLCTSQEVLMKKQDQRKAVVDQHRRNIFFNVGDKVLLHTHTLSNAQRGYTNKFSAKRDGPYVISKVVTPTSYELTTCDSSEAVGRYHVSDITPYLAQDEISIPEPVVPKKKRGRPKKM